jgi:hypothetical protein
MKKEAALALGALVLSQFAFSRPIRRQIGNEANWQCEVKGCGKGTRTGWILEANHDTPAAEGGSNRASNGSMKCLEHHYKFHKERGDDGAARLILWRIQQTAGGRTLAWREHRKK